MKSIEIKFVASSHCVLRHEKFGTQDLTSWPPPMWQTLDSIPENCIGIATGALIAAKELHNQFGREEGKPHWRIFVIFCEDKTSRFKCWCYICVNAL